MPQREACEAYARSQRHEGWTLLPGHYDDGRISGGTMERPALQQLLADIRLGKIDLILVYKVDRLTRSLPDFAKIVDVLDAHGASFVSVKRRHRKAGAGECAKGTPTADTIIRRRNVSECSASRRAAAG